MLVQAITNARAAGLRDRIVVRADSAYYGPAFVGTALRHGTWVSDAEVAEVAVTAFTGRRRADHGICRLVVRRITSINQRR